MSVAQTMKDVSLTQTKVQCLALGVCFESTTLSIWAIVVVSFAIARTTNNMAAPLLQWKVY